jgi:hypothetical protein
MRGTRCSSEMYNWETWIVIRSRRFNFRHADFHDDDSDGFNGVERWAGLAIWRSFGSEVVGEELSEICKLSKSNMDRSDDGHAVPKKHTTCPDLSGLNNYELG